MRFSGFVALGKGLRNVIMLLEVMTMDIALCKLSHFKSIVGCWFESMFSTG